MLQRQCSCQCVRQSNARGRQQDAIGAAFASAIGANALRCYGSDPCAMAMAASRHVPSAIILRLPQCRPGAARIAAMRPDRQRSFPRQQEQQCKNDPAHRSLPDAPVGRAEYPDHVTDQFERRRSIMTERLDLLKIAQEEQSGDLFKLLDSIYKRSKVAAARHFRRGHLGRRKPARRREAGRARVDRHVRAERHADGARRAGPAVPRRADDGAVPARHQARSRSNGSASSSTPRSSGPPPATPWSTRTARRSWSSASPPMRRCAPRPASTATSGPTARSPACASCPACRTRRTARSSRSTRTPATSTPR